MTLSETHERTEKYHSNTQADFFSKRCPLVLSSHVFVCSCSDCLIDRLFQINASYCMFLCFSGDCPREHTLAEFYLHESFHSLGLKYLSCVGLIFKNLRYSERRALTQCVRHEIKPHLISLYHFESQLITPLAVLIFMACRYIPRFRVSLW